MHLLHHVQAFYHNELIILESDNWKQNHWKMTIHLSCHLRLADRFIAFKVLPMKKGNKTCVMVILMLCDF